MPLPSQPTDLSAAALPRVSPSSPPPTTSTVPSPSGQSAVALAVPLPEASRLQLVDTWQAKYAHPAWSPDSSLLAFETEEGDNEFVGLLRLSDLSHPSKYPIPTAAWALAFSPDGQTLAVVHKFCWPLRYLDVMSGDFTEADDRDCPAGGIWASYTPQGDYIYVLDAWGSPDYGDNSSLSVCQVSGHRMCRGFKEMKGYSGRAAILNGGDIVAPSVGVGGTVLVYLWQTDNGELFCTIQGGSPTTNTQGNLVAVAADSQGVPTVAVWDTHACILAAYIEDNGIPLAVDPTGRYVVVYDKLSVRVLDLQSSAVVSNLKAPVSLDWVSPGAISVSPDWRFVAIQRMSEGTELLSLFAAEQ